jgi:hypothetical protein
MSNKELWEGFVSAAQRKAVWASKADGGKGHPDNKKKKSKKEDVNEISKGMAGRYLKKVPASSADAGRKSAGTTGIGPEDQKKNTKKGVSQFVNRNKGTSMAVDKMTGKAKVPATESVEVSEKHVYRFSTKTKQGNIHHSSKDDAGAKKAIEKKTGEKVQSMTYRGPKKEDSVQEKTAHMFDNEKDARAKAKEIGGKYVRGKGVSAGKHAAVKEDSDAVKAFLAKGGKIKKLPPAKAQGYHGKDDPGKDVAGVMDKPDTDKFKTRKKVKSMENKVHEDPEMAKMIAKNNAAQQAKRDAANPAAAAKRKAAQANIAKRKPVTPDSIGRHSSQGGGFIGTRESALKTFDDLRSQLSESMLGHSDAEKLNGGKSKDDKHKSAASHIDYHHRQSGGHNKSGGDQDRHRYNVAKKLGYNV